MNNHLPNELLDGLKGIPGFDRRAFEAVHESGEQVTSIRLNPFKSGGGVFPVTLQPFKSTPVPWCSLGYYLEERPSFTFDPLFHAGAYYVQEASSMFLEQAVKHTADLRLPLKALDLCAAPGGKSTLLSSLLPPESLLVSNEVIRSRVGILADNVTRWGAANTVVTCNDPKDFRRLENFFDLVVVDAPCSGSGLFRKDREAVKEWSAGNVNLCSQRQQRILADVAVSLKPGGMLIYCTCSYSPEEDEMIADRLMDQFPLTSVEIPVDAGWGIVPASSPKHGAAGYRFYPDKLKGEGFFLAAFRKQQSEEPASEKKDKPRKKSVQTEKIISEWISEPEKFEIISIRDDQFIVPHPLMPAVLQLQQALYLRQAGINAGRIAGKELIPAHALALSGLTDDRISRIPLKKEEAIRYLRKEPISVATGIGGWAMVSYEGYTLGWIKILPGRVNNYFPREWRILQRGY